MYITREAPLLRGLSGYIHSIRVNESTALFTDGHRRENHPHRESRH